MTKTRVRKAKPKYEVVGDQVELDSIGVELAWLDKLHEAYAFDKFEYINKFKAFRCYKDGAHLDWVDVNDLAILNGHRRLIQILLPHQRVSPKRAVIQLPWR